MLDLNSVKPTSLTAVVNRVFVGEYWYRAEVWGSEEDKSGNVLGDILWAGAHQYKYHADARFEAQYIRRTLLEEME